MSAALSPPPSSGYSNFTSLSGRVQNTDEIQDALVQLYCQTEVRESASQVDLMLMRLR
jgi:hypothetical protein